MMKPWYEQDRYDTGVCNGLENIVVATQNFRERLIRSMYIYEWAYERDKFFNASGRLSVPLWLSKLDDWSDQARPNENILKSRIDALVSLLMTDQPAVEVRVSGADFETARAGRARSEALNALFNEDSARLQLQKIGRSALIAGACFCRPVVRNGRVRLERIRLDKVIWDPYDARDDDGPSFIAVDEWMDRRQLRTWLQNSTLSTRRKAWAIKQLDKALPSQPEPPYGMQSPYDWLLNASQMTSATDRIHVRHAWKTASSTESTDGRYVCVLVGSTRTNNQFVLGSSASAVLMDCEFARTTLPIVPFSPWPPEEGLVGVGFAAQIWQTQREIDYHWGRVSETSQRVGWTKVITPKGTLNEEAIAAFAARQITVIPEGADERPVVIPPTPGIIEADLNYIQTLKDSTAQTEGINQVLAGGQTQLGSGASGVALAEEADRQVDRMSDVYENWGVFRLGVARELLNAIEDAVRMDGSFSSSWRSESGSWQKHNWEDLSSPNAAYDLGLEEAGQLARTRAGRLAAVIAQAEQGNLDPADARRYLLSTPDLRRLGELALAGRRRVESDLDELVKPNGDHNVAPDPDYDLVLAIRLSQDMINLAATEGAKPETLIRLAEYRRTAQALQNQATADAQLAQVQAAGAGLATEQLTQQGTEQVAGQMTGAAAEPPLQPV